MEREGGKQEAKKMLQVPSQAVDLKQNIQKTVPWRLSVAPMMDWTDRHCRYFHRLLSRHALLYTEMVDDRALVHGDVERHLRFMPRSNRSRCNWAAASLPTSRTRHVSANDGDTAKSTSTADAPASACSAGPSAPA